MVAPNQAATSPTAAPVREPRVRRGRVAAAMVVAVVLLVAVGVLMLVHLISAKDREQVRPESSITQTRSVSASEGWQVVRVTIPGGAAVSVTVASGSWTHWRGTVPSNEGDGESYVCADLQAAYKCTEPMPTARKGALIARVGTQLVAVGRGANFIAEQSGELELRINDDDAGLADNDGMLSVTITVA